MRFRRTYRRARGEAGRAWRFVVAREPFNLWYRQWKLSQLRGRPDRVNVELTNRCNARCVYCPREQLTRSFGVMSERLFRKVAAECAVIGAADLTIAGYGEPTLVKTLPDYVGIAKSAGVRHLSVITNAQLLTSSMSRALVEAGIDELRVSVDSASKETFEALRVHLDFEVVIANLREFDRLRESALQQPRLLINAVGTDIAAKGMSTFRMEFRRSVDFIGVGGVSNWAIEGYAGRSSTSRSHPCHRPFSELTVLWDGRVSLCCLDFNGDEIVGDVNDQTVGAIWRGERMERRRAQHLAGARESVPLCKRCNYPDGDDGPPIWWRPRQIPSAQ